MVTKRKPRKTLQNMPYWEYLRTAHWKRTRFAALKRAGFKCQLCNSTKNLEVHHRTYIRRGKELASDLITLCSICHGKFHGKKR